MLCGLPWVVLAEEHHSACWVASLAVSGAIANHKTLRVIKSGVVA